MDIPAQILSIFGMIFNFISFQQKNYKKAVLCQLLASSTFCISYFMLGAMAGGILNIVGSLRALLFVFKEKTKADHIGWLILFSALFVLSYPLSFTVFDKEPTIKNLIIEILPVIAMIVTTVSIRKGSTRTIRYLGLISSPLWLTYNICCISIGAIASEVLNLGSIIIGIVRFDKKKNEK